MAFNSTKNYYNVLGITCDASIAEIKTAYRKMARLYHPDINKSPDAIQIFKEITQAYETLSNPKSRNDYDILNGIFKEEQTTSYAHTEGHKTNNNTNVNNKEKNQSNKASNNQYSTSGKKSVLGKHSVLKSIRYFLAKFKKNERARLNKKPQKGQDITTDISVTPEEVLTGSKRIINVLTTRTCPICFGHRFVNGGKCKECDGKGEISSRKKIIVTIPKGIKNGAKLRLKNEGGSGKNGGSNGDLYINIKIETQTKVHFDKQNIYYNIPITPYEAALGEEIKIPTFDGVIKLKLPPHTCSGQKFRIAGQGIKKNGKTGDLIIIVSIEFSHDLSDDEVKLYEQLKNLSNDDIRKNLMNEN